ncbi:MAG: DUF488 family protein [Planctomycetaceae bacterium]
MSTNDRRQAFHIEIRCVYSATLDNTLTCVSVGACLSELRDANPVTWLPELAPSAELAGQLTGGRVDEHEFRRRYSLELEQRSEPCEWLRSGACNFGLALMTEDDDTSRCAADGLKQHLENLECRRRWRKGLMIGGYVYHLKDEIEQAGGLWFSRHKTWMMPDRETWERIQSLLPGDF